MSEKLEEMNRLLNELTIKEEYRSGDSINHDILADWISDNPHLSAELMEQMIRVAPDIIETMLKNHLTFQMEKFHVLGGERIRLELNWNGNTITSVIF